MAVSDVARAVNDLLSSVPRIHFDAGYVLALTGLVILAISGFALAAVITVRALRAIVNMTPEKFVIFMAVLAGIFIIAGSLLP